MSPWTKVIDGEKQDERSPLLPDGDAPPQDFHDSAAASSPPVDGYPDPVKPSDDSQSISSSGYPVGLPYYYKYLAELLADGRMVLSCCCHVAVLTVRAALKGVVRQLHTLQTCRRSAWYRLQCMHLGIQPWGTQLSHKPQRRQRPGRPSS